MIQETTITLFKVQDSDNFPDKMIRRQLAARLACSEKEINGYILKKKSLDARHGKVKFHLRYQVFTGPDKVPSTQEAAPSYKPCPKDAPTVVVVGSGPAGLFAALKLIQGGIRPIVLERGNPAPQRKRDIAAISTQHQVNPDSNYCFGEGGAGTFSDGKLYTRSNKRGNLQGILQVFHYFGASPQVLTDAHPHIGTDKLPSVIQGMTEKIRDCGGQVHFGCRCTGILLEKVNGTKKAVGVEAVFLKSAAEAESKADTVGKNQGKSGDQSKESKPVEGLEKVQFLGDSVILATGHSATDMYQWMAKSLPTALEDKTFAMGVRVEHPRELIDTIQFHGAQKKLQLGAAEYRLVTQVEERGVYSFCMCPGGLVVPSASCEEGLVVNGMSPSSRGGKWSNAAIVVEIRPQDFDQVIGQLEEKLTALGIEVAAPEDSENLFEEDTSEDGGRGGKVESHSSDSSHSRGLYLRTLLEVLTKAQGQGQKAPAQLLVDFLDEKTSSNLPPTTYSPGLVSSPLHQWLPPYIKERLQLAFKDFNKKMRGFICKEALLIASETRTSTPVRILRDAKTLECVAASNLYPAGEGAGYSGGIVSSAMDGEAVARAIIQKLAGTE